MSLTAADKREIAALVMAVLDARESAACEPAKAPAKAVSAPKPKASAPAPKARALTKASRKDFIAAHAWATPGMSTRALAEAVVINDAPLAKGWKVAAGYSALALRVAPLSV